MTTQTRNEAAEQLRQAFQGAGLGIRLDVATLNHLLDAALAAERRATVERIRDGARRQKIWSPTWSDILDKVAAR